MHRDVQAGLRGHVWRRWSGYRAVGDYFLHEGQLVLAKNITRILSDAVEWVGDDLFGAKSRWPTADVVMYLCQKRILVYAECKIDDGFSYSNIKRWTLEAPVMMKGRSELVVLPRVGFELSKPLQKVGG